MVSLNTYRSQVSLGAGRKANVRVNDSVGQAIGQVGQGLNQLDQHLLKRKEFQAQTGYRKMQTQLETAMFEKSKNMAEGGEGFHDGFMETDFNSAYDSFMSTIKDPRVAEKYEAMRGMDQDKWSLNAAKTEHGEVQRYQVSEAEGAHNTLMQGIAMNPEAYEAYLLEGDDFIDTMTAASPADKALMKDAWAQKAMTSLVGARMEADPAALLRDLGARVEDLTPDMQVFVTQQAMGLALGTYDPLDNAETVGRFRLNPADGDRLAALVGDEGFPKDGTDEEKRMYMSRQSVNEDYSKTLLTELLTKHKSDPQAVAFEYLAGPEETKKWLANGRKWTGISTKLKDRVQAVSSAITPSGVTPAGVTLNFGNGKTDKFSPATMEDLAGIPAPLIDLVKTSFAAVGIDSVNITSAQRSHAENQAVGGASQSRHKEKFGGDAIDIKLPANMSIADKVNLLRQLSASGAGGIGVYSTQIHVDMGGTRSWGGSHGSDSIPAWARDVMEAHIGGSIKATPKKYVAKEFSTLNEKTRLASISAAEKGVADIAKASKGSVPMQRAFMLRETQSMVDQILNTGTTDEEIDMAEVHDILTPEQFVSFTEDVNVAKNIHRLTDGVGTRSDAELTALMTTLSPEVTGDTLGAIGDRILAGVASEVEAVRKERFKNPAAAAMNFPAVSEAYAAIQAAVKSDAQGAAAGQHPASVNPPQGVGPQMQDYIAANLEAQASFNIDPASMAPVWRENALQVGERILSIIHDTDKTKEQFEFELEIWYAGMQETYGDFTDEVVLQALVLSKNLGADVEGSRAEQIKFGMTAINLGRTSKLFDQVMPELKLGKDEPPAEVSLGFNGDGTFGQEHVDVVLNSLVGMSKEEALIAVSRKSLTTDQQNAVMKQFTP